MIEVITVCRCIGKIEKILSDDNVNIDRKKALVIRNSRRLIIDRFVSPVTR